MVKEEKELTDKEFFLQRMQMMKISEDKMEMYPHMYPVTHAISEIRTNASEFEAGKTGENTVSSAGRIMSIRGHGKLFFFDVESDDAFIQLILNSGESKIYYVAELLRRGDIVGFNGLCGKSRSGEPSVFLKDLALLSPCLRVIPSSKNVLTDAEIIYRKRHLDLLVNKDSKARFITRTKIINYIRSFFNTKGFLEVETPMMHVIYGGAAAKPFKTHHNELKQDLYLRVAPELYLKKLVIGGINKVYEIGKNMRNEGIDLTHNPEFTACEAYLAYADYNEWMRLTEELLTGLAMELKRSLKFTYKPKKRGSQDISVDLDFSVPFQRFDILEEINKSLGLELTGENLEDSIDKLLDAAAQKGLKIDGPKTLNSVLDKLISEYIEPRCINPTFVTGFPTVMSPLAKEDRNKKGLTERFELFVNGKELCNSYTELNIPSIQRDRFKEQMVAKEAGEEETMPIDEDFCQALEYGLPPTGGWGIGIDRLVMYMTDAANIRDVIFFPTMRPENN